MDDTDLHELWYHLRANTIGKYTKKGICQNPFWTFHTNLLVHLAEPCMIDVPLSVAGGRAALNEIEFTGT